MAETLREALTRKPSDPSDPGAYRVENPAVAEELAYAGDKLERLAAKKIARAAKALTGAHIIAKFTELAISELADPKKDKQQEPLPFEVIEEKRKRAKETLGLRELGVEQTIAEANSLRNEATILYGDMERELSHEFTTSPTDQPNGDPPHLTASPTVCS